jgi:hypothetical protein
MTKQKSFKSRVRARMDKTSESYTAARRQLLAKSTPEPDAPADQAPRAVPVVDAPGARRPYSDEVIRANTGHSWDEWFVLLDGWGAAERPHTEIARWVHQEHGVGGWWAQGVTVAYEQARGLRAPGQRRGGTFEVSASKTVAVPVERWLPGAAFEVRTTIPAKSIRANWEDGSTRLVILFTAHGESKSQVALVHERLPDAATAEQLKPWWRERVAALKRLLET